MLRVLGVIALLWAGAVAVDQLWCTRRVSADVLLVEMDGIEMIASLEATSFGGVSDGKVYVKRWKAGRLKSITYWAPLSEFSADVAANLSAGRPPYGGQWPSERKRR